MGGGRGCRGRYGGGQGIFGQGETDGASQHLPGVSNVLGRDRGRWLIAEREWRGCLGLADACVKTRRREESGLRKEESLENPADEEGTIDESGKGKFEE